MKKCKDGRKNNVIPDYAKDIVASKRVYVDMPADTTVVRSTDKAHLLLVDGREFWAPKSMTIIAGNDITKVAKFIVEGWGINNENV